MTSRPQAIMELGQGPLATINWINYGWPGCGKTRLFGTASKALIVDCDSGGTSSLDASFKRRGGKVAHVTDFKELDEIVEHFENGPGCKEFDWFFWDSGTLFMDRTLIDDVTAEAAESSPKQSPYVASQREYLIVQNRIGMYFRTLCDLPINFAMSAHVMGEGDEETGELVYMPMLPGKRGAFSSKIQGYANLVTFHGKTSSGGSRLIAARHGHYLGKDRFHALLTRGKPFIDNPTVPKIEALINKRKKSE